MSASPRRAGFTLVELLMTLGIALMVLSAALGVWSLLYRSQGVTGAYQALQASLLVEEQIEADLERVMIVQSCPVRFWTKDPGRLSFYASDPAPRADGSLGLHAVLYSHEKPGAYLVREAEGRKETIGTMPLASITFTPFDAGDGAIVRVALEMAQPEAGPKGPAVVRSFLTRLPRLRSAAKLQWTILSRFRDKADAPGDQTLPVP